MDTNKLAPQKRTVIVITLVDNKRLEVNGPWEERTLMVQMLEEALKTAKFYGGGKVLLASNEVFTELDKTKVNHRVVIK